MKHFIIAAEIYLAGGCFWGTEHFLKQIRGVESTEVGYANSIINQPTYQQVCSGETNAAETVKVVYDPETVNLSLLLELYFKTIDPTSLNRQGNDRGTQYRTGIYYTNKADIAVINQAVRALADQYKNPIAIEVKPLTNFYPAENYHQDYLDKNPNGYCHINPALFEMARKANAPKYKAADNIKEWIGAEQMEEIYGMSKNARCSFVHRHKIPSRVVYGKVQYSKDHIDIIKNGGFDQRERYYSVTEAMEKYGIRRDDVYNYARYNSIRKMHHGKSMFLQKEDFDKVMAEKSGI